MPESVPISDGVTQHSPGTRDKVYVWIFKWNYLRLSNTNKKYRPRLETWVIWFPVHSSSWFTVTASSSWFTVTRQWQNGKWLKSHLMRKRRAKNGENGSNRGLLSLLLSLLLWLVVLVLMVVVLVVVVWGVWDRSKCLEYCVFRAWQGEKVGLSAWVGSLQSIALINGKLTQATGPNLSIYRWGLAYLNGKWMNAFSILTSSILDQSFWGR